MTIWTESELAAWQAAIPADFPDWRRNLYESTRRQNCPTFAETRAAVRASLKLCTDAIRKARTTPGWLTPRGHEKMHGFIRHYRAEHSYLVAAERAANLVRGSEPISACP